MLFCVRELFPAAINAVYDVPISHSLIDMLNGAYSRIGTHLIISG
jgi:hypothetical protein